MTKALDAAILAAHAIMKGAPSCFGDAACTFQPCSCSEAIARAALRAALPAEPTPELRKLMIANQCMNWRQSYELLRAHLLGEDA